MTSGWLLVATVVVISSRLTSAFTPPMNGNSNLATASATQLGVAAATQYDIVNVDLTDGRDYPIYIGSDFTDAEASALLRKHVHGKRVLLITNDRIAPMYLEKYEALLGGEGLQVDTVVLPDGEENKSFDIMSMILDRALELGLDRRSTFVALGGGVIGDMVGFASAIYQRGVNFIQVRLDIMTYSALLQGGRADGLYEFAWSTERSPRQSWQWWTHPSGGRLESTTLLGKTWWGPFTSHSASSLTPTP